MWCVTTDQCVFQNRNGESKGRKLNSDAVTCAESTFYSAVLILYSFWLWLFGWSFKLRICVFSKWNSDSLLCWLQMIFCFGVGSFYLITLCMTAIITSIFKELSEGSTYWLNIFIQVQGGSDLLKCKHLQYFVCFPPWRKVSVEMYPKQQQDVTTIINIWIIY